jgi:hypothetical protein
MKRKTRREIKENTQENTSVKIGENEQENQPVQQIEMSTYQISTMQAVRAFTKTHP